MKRCLFSILVSLFSLALVSAHAQTLRVAFVGDPQVDNERELDYARKSVYRDLAMQKNIDFAVILGDLVNDEPRLLAASKAIIDSLPFPCFVIPGNHDFDVYPDREKPRDLATFTETIGPADTAFVAGRYRFVLMNNVRIADKRGYEGGFSQSQKDFLDSLVNVSVSDGRKLILATHIPVSYMKGQDTLSRILSPEADYLLISGHTHSVARGNWITADGRAVPQLVAGATCGSWWRGVKGPDGVPYALQNCGAPRGYFIAEMKPRKIRLAYRSTDSALPAQVSVFMLPDSLLAVNVFGGAESGEVRVRQKSFPHRWKVFDRSEMTAPEVEREIVRNASATRQERKERKNDFIPLRRKKSSHIWCGKCHLSPGDRITVIYRDEMMRFRQDVTVQSGLGFPQDSKVQ